MTSRSIIAALLTAALALGARPVAGQSVQYRSPAGVVYRSLADTGAVARARSALVADPRNIGLIIALGVAQSGGRQFREAIATFTRGLEIASMNALLYRWRGHRHLSVREFDRAMADLTRGLSLDSTNYGILYHLGRSAEAQAMLDRRPDSVAVDNAYTRRLRLYRGQITPDEVLTAADTGDVNIATLSYGVGNWFLLRGDTAHARSWFERSVRSGGWPAFGFIVSEAELRRLR